MRVRAAAAEILMQDGFVRASASASSCPDLHVHEPGANPFIRRMIEAGMVAGARLAGLRGRGVRAEGCDEDRRSMKESGVCSPQRQWPVAVLEVGTAFALLAALSALAGAMVDLPAQAMWAAAGVLLAACAAILYQWPDPRTTLGPANRVTLGRAVLVALVAGAIAAPAWVQQHATWVAAVAAVALALDGVDGWVARRWRCASAFGARFDMELDAFLILALCVHLLVMGKAGSWVLAIGAMRYVFVAAMRIWPWLDGPLPESSRRKLVCVWQVGSLLLCLLPAVGAGQAAPLLALALGLLAWSFAVDVRWRYVNGSR